MPPTYNILTVQNKKDEKFLRKKTSDFDFKKMNAKEINALIFEMKKVMRNANGIGLSANQIGLDYKIFVAEVPSQKGGSKFYAVFNPKIEKMSSEKVSMEEGCLSVPGLYGAVERPAQIIIRGFDKKGKPLKIKAWGLLARVFQHEIDHLNGFLFIDKASNLVKVPTAN